MMGEVGEITREELLNASHASATTLQQLEKRGMLETYEVEVGRLNHGGDYHPELIKPLNSAQQTIGAQGTGALSLARDSPHRSDDAAPAAGVRQPVGHLSFEIF